MIDNYAWTSIFLRVVTLTIMVLVGYKQFLLLRTKSDVQGIKYLLMFLVAVILFNQMWSLLINFYRGEDGNLMTNVRHLSMIFNATSGLASAIGWHVLYKDD